MEKVFIRRGEVMDRLGLTSRKVGEMVQAGLLHVRRFKKDGRGRLTGRFYFYASEVECLSTERKTQI